MLHPLPFPFSFFCFSVCLLKFVPYSIHYFLYLTLYLSSKLPSHLCTLCSLCLYSRVKDFHYTLSHSFPSSLFSSPIYSAPLSSSMTTPQNLFSFQLFSSSFPLSAQSRPLPLPLFHSLRLYLFLFIHIFIFSFSSFSLITQASLSLSVPFPLLPHPPSVIK